MDRLILFSFLFFVISCSKTNLKQPVNTSNFDKIRVAILDNDFESVSRLIAKGVNLDSFDQNKETLLILACRSPSVDEKILSVLVSNGGNLFYESPVTLVNPIQLIYENKAADVIEKFLHNLSDSDRNTLLKHSYFMKEFMYEKHLNTFHKVLPLCIDEIIREGKGFNLLQNALEQWASIQVAYGNQLREIGYSSLKPYEFKKVVKLLLDYGVPINNPDSNDSVFAYIFESPEVISFVLENGYDVSKKLIVHGQEKTTLDMYIRTIMNRINGKFVLFDQEIIVSDPTNGFENPYELLICELVSNNKLAEAEILLELKNDLINSKNLEDENLFMLAQQGNYTQMLELLNVFK